MTRERRIWIVLLLVAALTYWPVWQWYINRYLDQSDEPLGVLALLTLFIVLVRRGGAYLNTRAPRDLWAVTACATLYVIAAMYAPQAV